MDKNYIYCVEGIRRYHLEIVRIFKNITARGIFKKSPFVKNATVLTSGTAVAQGLTIAAAPILARLYGPADFGVVGLFAAITGIISMVSSLRYELAIVLPKEDENASNIMALSCIIVVLMSGLSALLIWMAGGWLVAWLNSPDLASVLWWAPVSILCAGLYKILNFWSIRQKYFNTLSISKMSMSVSKLGSQIPAGLANMGSEGLVGGRVVGQIIATLVLGNRIWRNNQKLIKGVLNVSRMKSLAKEQSSFPKYSGPQALLSALSKSLPAFLFSYIFETSVVGFYWFTYRLLHLPSDLIGQSVRQVFYQKASELNNKNKSIYPVLNKMTFALAVIGIFPLLIILFFGPTLFSFVFGTKWVTSGLYAQWLVIMLFFQFINIPCVMSIPIIQLQHVLLIYEVVLFVFQALAILVGAFIGDEFIAIAMYSIIGAIFSLWLLIFTITRREMTGIICT